MERRVDRTEEVSNQLRGLIAMRLPAMSAVALRRMVAGSPLGPNAQGRSALP